MFIGMDGGVMESIYLMVDTMGNRVVLPICSGIKNLTFPPYAL